MRNLPHFRTIWILSVVSLLADVASEMLYPVMPGYLRSIGFSVGLIGLLEGLAEALAGLGKGYFGRWSDQSGRRLPFVRAGYFLSALSKPLMVLYTQAAWVFGARLLDRLGKGLRTGARDALLRAAATPETRARVFGFHRGMDTLGAVLGPALALVFLAFYPGDYRSLFLYAFLPGMLAVGFTLALREVYRTEAPGAWQQGTSWRKFWQQADPGLRRLTIGWFGFALFNSSDAFLLLKMQSAGLSDQKVILVYMGFNLAFALASYPLGALADKIGFRKVVVGGLLLFAGVYGGFAVAHSTYVFLGLFVLYGVYMAATDGVLKAWAGNLCTEGTSATALGLLAGGQSVAMLAASALTGLLWEWGGPALALGLSAIAAAVFGLYFAFARISEPGIRA